MAVDQFSLFDQPQDLLAEFAAGPGWPDHRRLPYNGGGKTVEQVVLADLRTAERPLLIAGYASLDRLIDYLAEVPAEGGEVRVLLGSEPYPARREHISITAHQFTAEVERYWIHRGISLRLSGKVIKVIEYLRQGRVRARCVDRLRLHAKMYCTQVAVTLGSSNFSQSGLRQQLEANARFERGEERFAEAWQLAERYWEHGDDFSAQLIALLEKLLRLVDWHEALARACAELLEGEWARGYLERQQYPGDLPLWPSQKEGIAQALWLLENVGSVLVADATGSGKTRMGAHLVRAELDRIWGSGRARNGAPMLVCPPAVKGAWDREALLCGLPLVSYSHGSLSQAASGRQDLTVEALRRAQILAVDEAHNFLNLNSQRTKLLLSNMADHTVLFTATPINRSVVDLLRLVDMLGADNLQPSTLKMFEKLLRRRQLKRSLTEGELDALRQEIQRFTMRRTKTTLNQLVDRQPEAYRDADKKCCRYPRHRSRTYSLNEVAEDREIAARIREQAAKLRGLAYLAKPIEMPDVLRREGWSEEQYLRARLHAASRLPAYLVMATLRSSRGALLEHVRGTEWALQFIQVEGEFSKQSTGNAIQRLMDLAGKPPRNKLTIPLPEWLADPALHKQACHEEEAIYTEIGRLAIRLSGTRESRKAAHLATLLERHDLVLAFDSRPITLAQIRRELTAQRVDVLLATGGRTTERKRVHEALQRNSQRKRLVALCSDSMSEGVNLQRASCVVHLDMPSVVRIAEQRVGRVDRMDSPHEEIEAWWPEDAPEFALRTDERFIERFETVEALLGSNLPLPAGIQERATSKVVTAEQLISEFEEQSARRGWDGIQDAFAPVRELVEGEKAVIAPEVYARYRHVTAQVLARVSLVRSHSPWAFFCLAGTGRGAPKWLMFSDLTAKPSADLPEVAEALRERLGPEVESVLNINEPALQVLERFLERLQDAERSLLPRKKQRALEEMRVVLERYQQEASEAREAEQVDGYDRLLRLLAGRDPNGLPEWNDVAERWLDLIRPAWYRLLSSRKRSRPLLLKDLRPHLFGEMKLEYADIRNAFREVKQAPPLDERVAACILGVK